MDVSSLRLRPRKHVSAIRISVFNVLVASCPILATLNKLLLDERNVSMSIRNSVTSDGGIKLGIMTYPLVTKDSMFDGDNEDDDDDDNSICGGGVEGSSIVVVIVIVMGW